MRRMVIVCLLAGAIHLPAAELLQVFEVHRYNTLERPYRPGLVSTEVADPGMCFVEFHCAKYHGTIQLLVGKRTLPMHHTRWVEARRVAIFEVPTQAREATLILQTTMHINGAKTHAVPVSIPAKYSERKPSPKPDTEKPAPYKTRNGTVAFTIKEVRKAKAVAVPHRLQSRSFAHNPKLPSGRLIHTRPGEVTLALEVEVQTGQDPFDLDRLSFYLGRSHCLEMRGGTAQVLNRRFKIGAHQTMSFTCKFLVPEDVKTLDLRIHNQLVAQGEPP